MEAATDQGPNSEYIQILLDSAHPSLSDLPKVEGLALDAKSRTTFVSGQLGFALEDVGAAFELADSDLILQQSDSDSLGFTIERYSQQRNGLEVIGGDLRVARLDDGSIHAASGRSWNPGQVLEEAQVAARPARQLAMAETRGVSEGSDGRLVYVAPSDGRSPVLAWHFVLQGDRDGMPVVDDVYVDALLGGIVDRQPRVHSARQRQTYDAGGQETLGQLARGENSPPTGDLDIDQAHDAARLTYDCLLQLFGRDSFDGAGASLTSVANFGQNFQNAFWDGSTMVYGDGMAVADVGTHEFVHAVTEYTGNMIYQNEPGALNEAWSDILSAVCEAYGKGGASTSTWSLGEELPIGTLRYMNDPTRDGISSDHYSSRYQGSGDEGGVHRNSGIANLAFYLLSQGGTHPQGRSTVQVKPIGITDAGQVFYRALASYMNTNTDFVGARVATEQAAADLFGAGSSESISVSEAWSSVGVGGPAPERQIEPEPDPGPDPDPGSPVDDDGTGDGTGGDPLAGTGTVVGGCSAVGSNGGSALSLLLILAFAALIRRKNQVSRSA